MMLRTSGEAHQIRKTVLLADEVRCPKKRAAEETPALAYAKIGLRLVGGRNLGTEAGFRADHLRFESCPFFVRTGALVSDRRQIRNDKNRR
jgi:hypothetical protein